MPNPINHPRPRALPRTALVAACAIPVVFALGRWSVEDPAPSPPEQRVSSAWARPAPDLLPMEAAPLPPTPLTHPPSREVGAAPPHVAPPSPAVISQQVAARVHEEAKAQLETLRPHIISQCWPAGGLDKGQASAKVTFNITFDSQGREIARGITEDRRAPAGKFGRCLREMGATTTLAVSAPGMNVGVAMPLSYP